MNCTRCQKEADLTSIKVEKPEWMVDVRTPSIPINLCKDCIEDLERMGCKFNYETT